MSTRSKQSKNTVPVGKTPVAKYVSWDDHRDAMRHDVEARRTTMKRHQAVTVTN